MDSEGFGAPTEVDAPRQEQSECHHRLFSLGQGGGGLAPCRLVRCTLLDVGLPVGIVVVSMSPIGEWTTGTLGIHPVIWLRRNAAQYKCARIGLG